MAPASNRLRGRPLACVLLWVSLLVVFAGGNSESRDTGLQSSPSLTFEEDVQERITGDDKHDHEALPGNFGRPVLRLLSGDESASSEAHHKESSGSEAGEAAEEKTKGAEGDEEKVTPLMFTIGVLISLFVFANVMLLYLLNWKDENVRSSIYKMISSTMSIFLAVTLNSAIFGFIIDQVLCGKHPGLGFEKNTNIELITGMIIFVISFASLNCAGYYWRSPEHIRSKLYPMRIIGGHITAFAGITAFGTVQIYADKSQSLGHHHYITVALAFLVLIILRECSRQARTCAVGGRKVSLKLEDPKKEDAVEREVDEKDEWRVEVCEGEDDATSLIISFLMSQIGIWCFTGKVFPLTPHGKEEKELLEMLHPRSDICDMGICLFVATIGLIFAVLTRRYLHPTNWLSVERAKLWQEWIHDPTKGWVRSMNNAQMIAAMSMSWFFLIGGFWSTQHLLHGSRLDNNEMAKVVNATMLTALAVILVIVIDMAADKLSSDKSKASGAGGVPQDTIVIDADTKQNVEKFLRTIIDALGLLVGLCWEKATDAAIEIIVEGNHFLRHHTVLSKVACALIMMVMLFSAWFKYIVPKAQKTAHQHKVDIELESRLRNDPGLAEFLLNELEKKKNCNDGKQNAEAIAYDLLPSSSAM